ncbi:hypothetical protein GCM10010304_05500 [Streptomyces roseoviolaceus]
MLSCRERTGSAGHRADLRGSPVTQGRVHIACTLEGQRKALGTCRLMGAGHGSLLPLQAVTAKPDGRLPSPLDRRRRAMRTPPLSRHSTGTKISQRMNAEAITVIRRGLLHIEQQPQ